MSAALMPLSKLANRFSTAYVTAVVLVGTAILAYSARSLYLHPISKQWLVLAALTLLTGSFTVKVPSTNASLSVSETFVFASVLLFGAPAGAITVLLECLIILFWMKPQGRSLHRTLFNLAAPAIAIWVSGSLFFVASGIEPYSKHTTPLPILFFPFVAFTALYFLMNSWLVAIALGLETGQSATTIWWKNFTWLSINYFSGASVAALIVTYKPGIDVSTLAIIVPLLVVSYLTFRTAMGRVEDSNNHLVELNRLYLSTIETLAMAIDAKDQITHGHIRRVQAYAVGLAVNIGVSDRKLIQAIEAAALLHDMGKLAVPEHILNKPGKLTAPEFEQMKLHASVGADILSSIDFPYPVVPIVRYHHENWDGSGYPEGLKGTDIPIGARILAVVDCFDALTSDRPYRRRLTDSAALDILLERRGSMYDPLIVDAFVRVHADIEPSTAGSLDQRPALLKIRNSSQQRNSGFIEGKVCRTEQDPWDICSSSSAGPQDRNETLISRFVQASNDLKRTVPFSISVFYLFDQSTDSIEAACVVGDRRDAIAGLRIRRGQRVSGWVAANRRTIMNSDPCLDLGDVARLPGELRTCMSTPVTMEGALVGVFTVYCGEMIGEYNQSHRRAFESVAQRLGCALGFGVLPSQPVSHLN